MTQISLTIRPVERRDMRAVIAILQAISDFTPAAEDLDAIWNDVTNQANVWSVVGVLDGTIVGYGSLVIETKIRGGRMGHIEDIVCHADFRKSGVGSAIVAALGEIAREKGCYKLALQCRNQNTGFYENCGFTVSGIAMQAFL